MYSDEKIVLQKLTKICSIKEYCIADLKKKLFQWKIPTEKHDVLIDYLLKNNFVNPKRYANAYVRDKIRFNKWGKLKIYLSLKNKHISEEIINTCLNEFDENEYTEMVKNELTKKEKQLSKKTDNYQKRIKIIRFGQSRGYELELLQKLVGE